MLRIIVAVVVLTLTQRWSRMFISLWKSAAPIRLSRHGWRHVESILHLCTHARTVGLTEYVDSTGRGSTFVVLETATRSLTVERNTREASRESSGSFFPDVFIPARYYSTSQFERECPHWTGNVESCILELSLSARGCVLLITRDAGQNGQFVGLAVGFGILLLAVVRVGATRRFVIEPFFRPICAVAPGTRRCPLQRGKSFVKAFYAARTVQNGPRSVALRISPASGLCHKTWQVHY